VSHGQPVRGVHHPSQICDENHKFDTSLARLSVFCVEFSDNFCATQTQKEFWDRSIGWLSLAPVFGPSDTSGSWNALTLELKVFSPCGGRLSLHFSLMKYLMRFAANSDMVTTLSSIRISTKRGRYVRRIIHSLKKLYFCDYYSDTR